MKVNINSISQGGECDTKTTAKLVLMDWQRGEIPFYTLPPDYKEVPAEPVIDDEELEKQNIELNNEILKNLLKTDN